MELTGKIKQIGQIQEVGSNGFQKRQLVITTNEQYPQDIPIDFVQDKCSILDTYKEGQNVTVGINLRGSEWKGKHYVNIIGWRIKSSEVVDLLEDKEIELPWYMTEKLSES